MKRLFGLLNRLFNVHIQKNQEYLLFSSAISGLIYTYCNSPICKEIISKLPPEWISFEGAWFCFATLIMGVIWKSRTREIAVKYFTWIALAESLGTCAISFYLVFIHYNVWVFAILSLFYSSIVSTFIGKCVMMFESKLWNGKTREMYDNTASIFRNGVAIVGFVIAISAMPSLNTAIIGWGLGCIFDDIGWIIVYNKTRKSLLDSIQKEETSP